MDDDDDALNKFKVNSKPTKNELLDHVVPHVTPWWYVLGLKLLKKDQEIQLDIIKSNHAGDNQMCCMEMFWYWLSTTPDASWQQLVEALRSPVVKLPVVAADIEKMFTGINSLLISPRSRWKEYICPCCDELMDDPVLTSCGHRMCYKCFNNRKRSCDDHNPRCTVGEDDGQEHEMSLDDWSRDRTAEWKINKLLVKCEKCKLKCTVKGYRKFNCSTKHEPDDIKEDKCAYKHVLKCGKASVFIHIVGQEGAGKTCLVRSLIGDKFVDNTATKGADFDVCTVFSSKWSQAYDIPQKFHKMHHYRLKATAEIKISSEQEKSVLKVENKQQLLDSLPELPKAVKADLEQAKTAVLIDKDRSTVIIWDLAGQSVYYELHSMFLKEDDVVTIVFDASQNLVKGRDNSESPDPQISINPTTTVCESICYWLNSIHSICRKNVVPLGARLRFLPTVILVATHLDLIGDSEEMKQEIIDQLVLALQGKPFAMHLAGIEEGLVNALRKNCIFISNKNCDQKALDHLRSVLAEALQYIVKKEQPIAYLNIEKTLLSLRKTAITTTEFHSIANRSGLCNVAQSAELESALAHFHSKGILLHFPQCQSLKDVVVLSPNWLTTLFAYVITAHPYKTECNYLVQFKRLKSQGVLEEDFIAYMVNKLNIEQKNFGLPLTTEQAIEFAQQFGFIVEINNYTYFLEGKLQMPASGKKTFIVPPMLPLELPEDTKLPTDNDPQARIIYFNFPEGFIPEMVYYQVLGFCIARNMKRNETVCWVRRKAIKLMLGYDQLYHVSLCEYHDSIRLAITPHEDKIVKTHSLQERWRFIEDFTTKLIETTRAFMPASSLPQRYVPCCKCSDLHFKLDDIRGTDKPLWCLKGKLPEDYYNDIRQYPGPTMQKLQAYLQVLKDWETFGYFLLPKDKGYLVEVIKKGHQVVESCKAALYKEFLKCGVVTWDTVINALEKCNELNLAKQVKMKVQDLNLDVTPSLKSLYQYITPHFATKWKAIGMQLGLPNEIFVDIEAGYSTNSKWCCNQMLEKWLDVDTTASWDKLLMAIESPAVSKCSEKVTSILDQLIIDKGKDECITQSNWVRKRYVQMKCKCDKEAWSSEMFTLLALVHDRNGSNKFTTTPEEIVSLLNPVLKHSGLFKDSTTKKGEGHEDPKYILIEGVPGIGKTCLAKHITYLWAEEQIPVLQNFKLLLLLFMQDPVVQQMSDLKQLLQLFWESNAEVTSACMHYLFKSSGKDIVFLLDGFDELPALQEGSIIDDLLKRKLLPHCHLIVTSRPRVSSILHHHANVRVDILGFTNNDRHSYIETVLGDQPDKISELTHYLSSHKSISSLCYIPLNLTILLYLYNHERTLPKNSAELYHSFVCLTIQRHLAKYVTHDITKLTDLSEPYNKRVQQLSKLSFEALIDKKWSFTLDQIKGACSDIDGVFDGCGLLQEVQHFSQCRTFNFIHSSIQEFLAAYHISTLSAKEKFKIFEEKFWNDDFFNMFSIYITLTKGQQPTFKKFLSDKEISISCKFLDDRLKSFRLYCYFCEADCIEMGNSFEQLEAFMSKGIYLAQTRLTTVDIQCIALFLASSSHKEWTEINLHGCDIQDYGIHILHRELHALSSIHIMTLQLSYNGLTEAASSLISDIIIKCKVKELWINGNHFIGEHQEFYSMLTNSVTLESLYLIDIQLSSQAAFSIFKALMHNNTLKELIITNNNISDDVCISITRALQNNSSLVKLWMWDNPIHSETLVLILKALQDNNTLALLGFPNCPEKTKMELESLQVDVNKKRENHGCRVKLVIDFM